MIHYKNEPTTDIYENSILAASEPEPVCMRGHRHISISDHAKLILDIDAEMEEAKKANTPTGHSVYIALGAIRARLIEITR
jgi:hypothetical protein